MFEIKVNKSGVVRTKLCKQDVMITDMDILIQFGLIDEHKILNESYYVFKEPFRVPRFNAFYASKISGLQDPYLQEAIKRLLYLNPRPDTLMKKKIAEFIVVFFSKTQLIESEVLTGRLSDTPILLHEGVFTVIEYVIGSKVMDTYEPDTEDFILYSAQSDLSKEQKISIRAGIRRDAAINYFQKAIHTATEYLIDIEDMVKLTHAKIKDTKMVETSKGVASVQTIRKYMSDRTKRIFDEHNSWAPFKSGGTYEKFKEFLDLDPLYSIEATSQVLQVSKSTVVEFRRIATSLKNPL